MWHQRTSAQGSAANVAMDTSFFSALKAQSKIEKAQVKKHLALKAMRKRRTYYEHGDLWTQNGPPLLFVGTTSLAGGDFPFFQ